MTQELRATVLRETGGRMSRDLRERHVAHLPLTGGKIMGILYVLTYS